MKSIFFRFVPIVIVQRTTENLNEDKFVQYQRVVYFTIKIEKNEKNTPVMLTCLPVLYINTLIE